MSKRLTAGAQKIVQILITTIETYSVMEREHATMGFVQETPVDLTSNRWHIMSMKLNWVIGVQKKLTIMPKLENSCAMD